MIGGLIVGPLVHFPAPEAEGHGVPEVIEAVTMRGGRIRKRVATVKSLASALTIGTGGSVGREGPVVQIGAALGSTLGQVLRLPVDHIKTLGRMRRGRRDRRSIQRSDRRGVLRS